MTKLCFSVQEHMKRHGITGERKIISMLLHQQNFLSVDTVDQLKDDGVTTMQFGKLEPEVYLN